MKSQNNRLILDYSELKKIIDAHKILGHKIVCTAGCWDMFHIGHLRYLIKAKEQGDVLVVGVVSDRGIKLYKNELRPIIPQEERMEMLKYQECVDYVTLIDDIDEKGEWQYELLKTIRPDIYVATIGSYYSEKHIKEIKRYSGQVIIFPRQAEKTSTTEIIERVIKKHLEALVSKIVKKRRVK